MNHVIMLANTADKQIYLMTMAAILSVRAAMGSSDQITLVETNANLKNEPWYTLPYNVDRLMFKTPFNYNAAVQFALRDLERQESDFFTLLNNDIVAFSDSLWFMEKALMGGWGAVSAWSATTLVQQSIHGDIEGYRAGHTFSGWAWMTTFKVIDGIGVENLFPEELAFWYQDNFLLDVLQKHRIRHALIRRARIDHLESRSHRLLENQAEATVGQQPVYESLRRKHGV